MSTEFLTIEGRKVRVAQAGDPANPPVLLVHGIGRSLEDWDELSERLADSYRIIRLDVPGFGYSDPPPGAVDHLARRSVPYSGICLRSRRPTRRPR